MKVCRFKNADDQVCLGLLSGSDTVLNLSAAGLQALHSLLESDNPVEYLQRLSEQAPPAVPLSSVSLLVPIDRQEVWAAGVTYLRSKAARMEESDFSASAYDRVYGAERPELFFKSLPEKAVPSGEPVGIRKDARWSVPEPELSLVINARGRVVGYTIGNDVSSRDIEGENVLYLPQAKIYHRSCALGPFITLGVTEAEVRGWKITLQIRRNGKLAFGGEIGVGQIKRSFDELAGFLMRSQIFPNGAVLLTGTGIVPPDTFTLQEGDHVQIGISGIGVLENPVISV
jgi:2-dehydro-3-deoxy-D-arabinonate dehydratase